MLRLIIALFCILIPYTTAYSYPYTYNPFDDLFRYQTPYYSNYGTQRIPTYNPYVLPYMNNLIPDRATAAYLATPDIMPTLNVLAELPYSVSNRFTVVPMLVMSKDNMNMVSNAHIMGVSKERPIMTIKTSQNSLLQCTPAVRIVLQKPMVVGSLKSNVLFPSEVQIVHEGFHIPLQIGAIIAPILPETYVSQQTPIAVRVVYAVPTTPITLNIFLNVPQPAIETDKFGQPYPQPQQPQPETPTQVDAQPGLSGGQPAQPDSGSAQPDGQLAEPDAVVVVSGQDEIAVESYTELPPKNVTIIDFPEKEAEPSLQVDEDDDELVNRNPPLVLAPAGIVQSTQPLAVVEPFHNPKESPFLSTLREEANRKRI